jgi:hypothetical protein
MAPAAFIHQGSSARVLILEMRISLSTGISLAISIHIIPPKKDPSK